MGLQPKVGGITLLKLNTAESPIENKYREGKLKRTLEREFKVLETVIVERLGRPKSRSAHPSTVFRVVSRRWLATTRPHETHDWWGILT